MTKKIRQHLFVSSNERLDHVRPDLVLHPRRRRRNQPLDVHLVRVDEEAHHGHLIVRLVGDVGHHDHARFVDVGIDPRGERIGRRLLLRAGVR